ncbi:Rhomboid domain-containing protein [Trichostrongylus colubriformis]|uniref:Rhomboid domain-containing protein n=1 Tax=Trichostrongylus colubriformis TaxID=6319 RepID=A0AAN8EZ12_TRICO
MAGKPQDSKDFASIITIATPTAATTVDPLLSQSLPTHFTHILKKMEDKKQDDHRGSETSAQSLPLAASARVSIRPPLNRGQSQIQMALNGSANFVGWNDSEGEIRRNWGSKRLRFLAKKYSLNQHRAINEVISLEPAPRYDVVDHPGRLSPEIDWNQSQPSGRNEQAFFFFMSHPYVKILVYPNTVSSGVLLPLWLRCSQASDTYVRPRGERRESAARLAYGSAASVAKRGVVDSQRMHRVRLSSRQSFDMDGADSDRAASATSVEVQQAGEPSRASELEGPTILRLTGEDVTHRTASPIIEESSSDIYSEQEPNELVTGSRSVVGRAPSPAEQFEMVDLEPSSYDASEEEVPAISSEKGSSESHLRPKLSTQEHIDADDLFFAFSADDDRMRAKRAPGEDKKDGRPSATVMSLPKIPLPAGDAEVIRDFRGGISRLDLGDARLHIPIGPVKLGPVLEEERHEVTQPDRPLLDGVRSISRAIHRYPLIKQTSVMETTKRGVVDGVLRNLGRHSGKLFRPRYRRYRGLGVLSSFYDGSLHREKIDALDPMVRDVIEAGSDERPLFTWWVTSVQVIVCIISLLFYGLGPAGWERVEMKEEVIDVTLVMRQVSYYEPVNLWIGPRFADLIRLGAKYSPCMRREPGLWNLITQERKKENATGCCVFNDRTGCYQTGQLSCPRTLATWHKWSKPEPPPFRRSKSDSFLLDNVKNDTSSRRRGSLSQAISTHTWRTAGAVCGQDPDFCIRPYSVKPYEWPDDLTRWPMCEEHRQGAFLPIHMTCQPEVGPSGSHLGIMAALVVDLHHHRHIIVRPHRELAKHMLTVFVLFLTGLLPWVDNWAHLFGFIFGLLITIVTFPYLDFESQQKLSKGCRPTLSRRHLAIVTSLILCVFLYFLLGYLYFHQIDVNCPWCQYFNCINIKYFTGSNHFCDNTGQKLSQWLPI